jgi:hypothetical protein
VDVTAWRRSSHGAHRPQGSAIAAMRFGTHAVWRPRSGPARTAHDRPEEVLLEDVDGGRSVAIDELTRSKRSTCIARGAASPFRVRRERDGVLQLGLRRRQPRRAEELGLRHVERGLFQTSLRRAGSPARVFAASATRDRTAGGAPSTDQLPVSRRARACVGVTLASAWWRCAAPGPSSSAEHHSV